MNLCQIASSVCWIMWKIGSWWWQNQLWIKINCWICTVHNSKGSAKNWRIFIQKNLFSTVYDMATLQDRYCLLMSTNGILQGESLFKCKLSNLCDLVHDMYWFMSCHANSNRKDQWIQNIIWLMHLPQECQFMCHWCLGPIFASKIPSNIWSRWNPAQK